MLKKESSIEEYFQYFQLGKRTHLKLRFSKFVTIWQ